MGLQPFAVVAQPALQQHLEVLHPSPVDLKEVSGEMFFCNISHRQVLTRTQCNSCCHSLGSLIIFFVKIKTQTKNRFYVYDTLYLLIKESISLQDFKFGFAIKDIYFPGLFVCEKKTQKKDLDKRNIRAWFVKICEQRTKLPS